MNKGLTKFALLSLVCSMMPATFTSCKDYDDDIDNLQGQIDAIKVSVDKLEEMVKAGQIITKVESTANGVKFTMSDNQTYEITNGKDGAPGTAWTIGEDGMWYKDGVKTDYKAIGVDGVPVPRVLPVLLVLRVLPAPLVLRVLRVTKASKANRVRMARMANTTFPMPRQVTSTSIRMARRSRIQASAGETMALLPLTA